ncbi:MAG: hypothetical protein AB1482_11675 [Pseudomonadota bacterium]
MSDKRYIKFTRAATVGGTTYQPGAIVPMDVETIREMFSKGLAVPSAGPGRRCLVTDSMDTDIRPAIGRSAK